MPLEARVKSVLSGDTLVLTHVTNPTQERILSLAYVSAPRLRREDDEVSAIEDFFFISSLELSWLSWVERELWRTS
jgi:staphylococcal nuclease domain-containing protein 1